MAVSLRLIQMLSWAAGTLPCTLNAAPACALLQRSLPALQRQQQQQHSLLALEWQLVRSPWSCQASRSSSSSSHRSVFHPCQVSKTALLLETCVPHRVPAALAMQGQVLVVGRHTKERGVRGARSWW